MDNESQHIQKLISIMTDRLQILEKQKAAYGIICPPHILLEIEDINNQIKQLRGKNENDRHIKDIIDIKKKRLSQLEIQRAKFGISAPVHIIMEIEELIGDIEKLNSNTPLDKISSHKNLINSNEKSSKRNQIFISYSHKDSRWLQRLQIHLKPLERLGNISRWDDTSIEAGKKWRDEIKKAINVARVAVLLVSADFLASDFIANNELPPLLSAAENEGAVILSVIVSPCRFSHTEAISQFQAVNSPSQPLNLITKGRQEAIFVKVTEAIEKVW
jgi:hypothetical protein